MLNIEPSNLSLETTLTELLSAEKFVSIDRIISDFDSTLFHISNPAEKTQLVVSIYMKCYADLETFGNVTDTLISIYYDESGNQTYYVLPKPEDGYNFSIVIDLEKAAQLSPEDQNSLVSKLALLRRNALSAPFNKAFERYDALSSEQPKTTKKGSIYITEQSSVPVENNEVIATIRYRDDETIYIRPSNDRVTVIFTALFKDETDRIFGSVFLQEFVDARKRLIQNAPQVLFSPAEPPLELRHLPEFANFKYGEQYQDLNTKGFVTFVLFPRHLTIQKRENTISQIELFRTYFHYHIKASKAYLHARMRKRVSEYLKILNRAKPDQEEKDIQRKTASGRTFVQRV